MPGLTGIRARLYDLCEASTFRRGRHKRALFSEMAGRVLFEAVGTGTDILFFPAGLDITAIDISEEMLHRAAPRAARYPGRLTLAKADALHLPFADASFDTVVTSCTMCSVPDAVTALRELERVLRPAGHMLMFEHVRSRNCVLGWILDLMTLWTRRRGTEMNRDTIGNVLAAGFHITDIEPVYLDIILGVRAIKAQPAEGAAGDFK